MLKIRKKFVGNVASAILLGMVLFLVVGMVVGQAEAGKQRWNVQGIASTLAPSVADTSGTINTNRCDDLYLLAAFEGDSATVYVDGSFDGATWINLFTKILNGVDGTLGVQWNGPLTSAGSAALSAAEFEIPPLNYTRVRLYNHDAADEDTLGSVTLQLRCTK